MKSIKILIVDDMPLIRETLRAILDLEEDMQVIGVCENGLNGYERTRVLLPDVVLMDVKMPVSNGVEGLKLIKKDFPKTVVLMLTSFDYDEYIIEALANGANGYLLKDVNIDNLIQAIRSVVNGKLLIESDIAFKLAEYILKSKIDDNQAQFLSLSEREKEISDLLIQGYSNKEISNQLNLSSGTIKNYVSSIYAKLGTNNREDAIKILNDIF
ncbi:response regulator transcription factor [Tepidibacter aestuarii]|uniref:response regulator transcription factor n=1 Tax=Tepidibacter aestuarii TaxID=2925782 RepID=UPI0020C0CAC7|nr:response regulator transcription factor [Tepidibacter aestuarii]CAH2214935.1 Transcriptional regulatory protein LnrK [Tepidibacter aestuarii]